MPEKQVRYVRPVTLGRGKHSLECYVEYPDADPAVGRGPYCIDWIPFKRKGDLAAAIEAARAQGIEVRE